MSPEAELAAPPPTPESVAPAIQVRRWFDSGPSLPVEPCFVFDGPDLAGDLSQASVLLATAGEARAAELIEAGAACVLLADAALYDSEIVRRLAQRHGPQRIGVWLRAQRMSVSWSLDRVSNADFKCLTPSLPQPAWEVLTSAGAGTGTLADWWIGQMRALGAGTVLLSLTHAEDADLAICAGLVEDCGETLWLAPPNECAVPAGDWSKFGQARQLVSTGCAVTATSATETAAAS